ncbi:MAG: hypothetical protein DMF84_11250 [Acidobacteria bacterium]|nr:MAG: hypothetical protein DMF84_11250 [Acidobacteriota bacterium]
MTGRRSLSVVVFSGGRGSSVLSKELITNPDIAVTLAINGYDDGFSTGEVRRFLGDSLGPSDFRKNASRLAAELKTCAPDLIELLDSRLPADIAASAAVEHLTKMISGTLHDRRLIDWVSAFLYEYSRKAAPFAFGDCSIGNLVFAGAYLRAQRDFNRAIYDYCALLQLPAGLIENVTDGTNAFLVALDPEGRLLASEADIVDANRQNRIKDIYLLERRPTEEDTGALASMRTVDAGQWLEAHQQRVRLNPRLVDRLGSADLIVYSPGTQHSSLFPSYLTDGLSDAIARNLSALKLLITNIQSDAELTGATAVDIVERAVYYLRDKGRLPISTPFLITHYLFNDPRASQEESPYVPLGRLDALEDPRLVRISNYEDGITGRHDPAKVLTPFLQSFLHRPRRQRVAVWLYAGESRSKISQTLLEMVRARIQDLALDVTVFYGGVEPINRRLTDRFPFAVRHVGSAADAEENYRQALANEGFDYALLFESSGMYNGEDLVSVAAPLTFGRLDAVWGSRRLSVRDIEASLRLRYRHNTVLRMTAEAGSHILSAAYLVLYGRYVSDTLSGVRGVRASYVAAPGVHLADKLLNQRLLSRLLAQRAEILETPVRFYAISPEQVRRTSVSEGLRSLANIVWWRVHSGETSERMTERAVAPPSDEHASANTAGS